MRKLYNSRICRNSRRQIPCILGNFRHQTVGLYGSNSKVLWRQRHESRLGRQPVSVRVNIRSIHRIDHLFEFMQGMRHFLKGLGRATASAICQVEFVRVRPSVWSAGWFTSWPMTNGHRLWSSYRWTCTVDRHQRTDKQRTALIDGFGGHGAIVRRILAVVPLCRHAPPWRQIDRRSFPAVSPRKTRNTELDPGHPPAIKSCYV